jgi:general secretion pathway protein D
MKKLMSLWVVVIVGFFSLSSTLYGIKSRRARRREKAEQKIPSYNNRYVTTVSVDGKDPSEPADLRQLLLSHSVQDSQDMHTNIETTDELMRDDGIKSAQVILPDNPSTAPVHAQFDQPRIDIPLGAIEKVDLEMDNEKDIIEFHFEDAGLEQLVTQIEQLFGITFITNDVIKPLAEGSKSIKGNKISFKTQQPLDKKHAWNLFTTFLQLAGFTVVPDSHPRFFHIMLSEKAQREPIPTFIGTNYLHLPDSSQLIRYIYFIENSTAEMIKSVVDSLRSRNAVLVFLDDIKAFMLIDHAYNIKSLMHIIKELDKVSVPQAMSVLKLKRADAQDVQQLYETLIHKETTPTSRLFPRKKPTARYFPENTRIIAEPRTNALILLGPPDAIKKIEDFIVQYIDTELDHPYSPLKVYTLKYAEAETIAKIMNDTVQFGKETQAGRVGGVRGGEKYFRDITFIPEPKTNRLIIKGEQEDYEKAIKIIKKLDEPQPQIAIEVLILTVQLREGKELGAQIRSRESQGGGNGLLGNHLKFQTSGLRAGGNASGIITNPTGSGVNRLLGDLINLVVGAPAANTILTLGQDAFGVWGIFQALDAVTNTEILANPFLVATNKTTASVSVGEKRRVVTGTIIGTNQTQTLGDEPAVLKVTVTPQINSDGMIVLKLNVSISAFTPDSDQVNVAIDTREIDTETIVADREVLALGGLIQNRIDNNVSKFPFLAEIPLFGWLFKNRRKAQDKNNLLILVSSRIIEPRIQESIEPFTQEKVDGYHGMLNSIDDTYQKRDPITRSFFDQDDKQQHGTADVVDDFLFKRHHFATNKTAQVEDISPTPITHRHTAKKQQYATDSKVSKAAEKAKPLPTPIAIANEVDIDTKRTIMTQVVNRKKNRKSLTEFMIDNTKGSNI